MTVAVYDDIKEGMESALRGDGLETLLEAMKACFQAYTRGDVKIAQVGHMAFDAIADHPGDCCVKSGFERGADSFVVKVASGFPKNYSRSAGAMSNSQGT